jgi:prepilin-type N-terminal cleavage/methylation domain-containing protein
MRKSIRTGFTLIELLIVVAIIAILAAIAVPNFLEAQTRSKVSRAKADMRSMATAIEAYYVDFNAYPKCNNFGTSCYNPGAAGPTYEASLVLERLSTPIAFMTAGLLNDPFITKLRSGTINSTDGTFTPTLATSDPLLKYFKYFTPGMNPVGSGGGLQDVGSATDKARYMWVVVSNGPSLTLLNMGGVFAPTATVPATSNNIYDPTNGTTSNGSIFRVGGSTTGNGNYGGVFFETVQRLQR